MSIGAGFAAGIGAGIAIGMSSGQNQGQKKVCDYLEANEIVLFNQEGKKISVDELREYTSLRCQVNNKVAVVLGILGLVLLLAIALVVYFSL